MIEDGKRGVIGEKRVIAVLNLGLKGELADHPCGTGA
jgi:hypothetical protein